MTSRNIFVVHGALGSSAQMTPVANALAALGDVHIVELYGHGVTPMPDGRESSIETFVDQLREVVTAGRTTGAKRPLIFGYSMGGYVALALESRCPGTFDGIATLGTKFAWTPEIALRERGRLDARVIAEKIPKFAQSLEARHREAGGWELVLERTSNILAGLGDNPILTRDSLGHIATRVVIAMGEKDDTVTREECQEHAGYIPGATCRTIPGAPHPIERVPSAAVAELVQELIDGGI